MRESQLIFIEQPLPFTSEGGGGGGGEGGHKHLSKDSVVH